MKDTGKREEIRVAYCLYTKERGGVEEHVLSLMQNINHDRYRSYLVAPPELIEKFGRDLDAANVTVYPLELKGLRDIQGMRRAYSFFRGNKIHIANTHMFVSSVFFSPAAKLAGVPVLIETSHGVEKWRFEKSFFKRNSYVIDKLFSSLQSKILAVSHACRHDLITIKKIASKKVVVVQNGRDLESFKPQSEARKAELRRKYGLSDSDYVFGVLARLAFQKGHSYLFEAIRLLAGRRQDFKVLLVGDGPLRGELRELAGRLQIGHLVIFAGFQKDMPGYQGMIDVNVLPSLYEGLPLGLVEASAMERPVIATKVDGTPEVISHEVNGLLVPPKDPRALCEAMSYALDNKDRMREMGRNGRRIALQQFSLERQIRETEALYEDLLGWRALGTAVKGVPVDTDREDLLSQAK